MWALKGRTMLVVVCVVLVVVASAGGPRTAKLLRQGPRRPIRTHSRRAQDHVKAPLTVVPRPRSRAPASASARVPLCPDQLTLEQRRDQANLIFTGRVEWLQGRRNTVSRHTAGPEGITGGVSVKRVFKGPARLAGQVVEVQGLGRWGVCNSLARLKDTKIFLTSLNDQGHVSLNSSLVRLTLKNLRTTAASPRTPTGRKACVRFEPCACIHKRFSTYTPL